MTRSTPRSTARSPSSCRPAAPAAAWCPASCTSSAPCRASTASPPPTTLGDGVDDLVARVTAAWTGPAGPKLRLLPEQIDHRAGPRAGRASATDPPTTRPTRRLYLGINEKELAPVSLDPETEPHLLLLGDGGSGKSAFLRTHVHEVMRTRTPKQAQIVVVDYRRSLLGEVPEEYLLNYLTSATQAQPALKDLAAYLESRIPGPDVTPEQLRNRSWWTGAEVFVVVDDYDLVATQQTSPVAAAAAAARPGPRRRPARDGRPSLRRRLARALRAGHPVDARPGHAPADALGQPRRGPAARQPAPASRCRRAAAGSSPASAASRSSRRPGGSRRS